MLILELGTHVSRVVVVVAAAVVVLSRASKIFLLVLRFSSLCKMAPC